VLTGGGCRILGGLAPDLALPTDHLLASTTTTNQYL